MTSEAQGKRVLLVHPTGNANVRQAALALEEAGMLAGFETTIAWHPGQGIDRWLPKGMRAELARRSFPDLPAEKIRRHPWREMARLVATRRQWNGLTKIETGRLSFDAVSRGLQRNVAAELRRGEAPDAVYVYDACAEGIMEAAKKRGMKSIYDLPIGHYRVSQRIVEEECELKPEWASTLAGIHDSAEKLAGKDRELELADAILVASTFTAETLKSFPRRLDVPVYRIAYGAPQGGPPREATKRRDPLRVLFVGQLGQRKGLSYLLDAVDKLGPGATLTLLGRPLAMPSVMKRALERHRWIESAPHAEVLQLMREHDVLVFPSLFDGFGLVMFEAMAQGTVVIATPNSGAPDMLEDDRDGFIVPIRSADAIAEKLAQLADDRPLLHQMSEAARQTAARATWDEYRVKLTLAVKAVLEP